MINTVFNINIQSVSYSISVKSILGISLLTISKTEITYQEIRKQHCYVNERRRQFMCNWTLSVTL